MSEGNRTGVVVTPSPMGWYYRVNGRAGSNPSVYRCKLGTAWERMDVYDLSEVSAAELRFIADIIDEYKPDAA